MEVPVVPTELTDNELYALEYALRHIRGTNRSPSALKLRTALGREIQWRAQYLLVDVDTIGSDDDSGVDDSPPIG